MEKKPVSAVWPVSTLLMQVSAWSRQNAFTTAYRKERSKSWPVLFMMGSIWASM